MTHEQALKATGEIVAATIAHMAQTENVSTDLVIELIADGNPAAVARFNHYMDIAVKAVRA